MGTSGAETGGSGPAAAEQPVEVKQEPKAELAAVKTEPGTEREAGGGQPSSSKPAEPAGALKQPSGLAAILPPSASTSSQQPPASQPSTSQAAGGSAQAEAPEGQDGGAEGKRVSTGDIQRVQNYIEKCLQMYLSQKEVIMQLHQQFKIEPCFTQLVWQKLEEQNQEFFKAYYTRLKLKDQIILFNHLLDEQVKMFQRLPRAGAMLPGAPMMQPRPGMAPFPQQAVRPAGLPATGLAPGASAPPVSNGFPAAGPSASQPPQLEPEAHGLAMGEFLGVGMDAASSDLPGDLGGMAQSLPFSGSEMNLAGMVSLGSPGRGLMGGAGDQELSLIPRNFSLSDLQQVAEGDAGGLPRNISLSDLPLLDLDSGGEAG